MTNFRTQPSINTDQTKSITALNSISGGSLTLTGLSLTNAQPLHVAIVDSSGSQVTSFGGGGPVTIADGADVAEGATTDAANTTGTTGTVSGKLRGIIQNQTNGNQLSQIRFQTPTTNFLTVASLSFASSGDNTIISATAAQTSRVFKIFFTVATACTVIFKSDATALTGSMTFTSGGSFVLDFDAEPWFITGTNEAFIINLSVASQVSGRVYYSKS